MLSAWLCPIKQRQRVQTPLRRTTTTTMTPRRMRSRRQCRGPQSTTSVWKKRKWKRWWTGANVPPTRSLPDIFISLPPSHLVSVKRFLPSLFIRLLLPFLTSFVPQVAGGCCRCCRCFCCRCLALHGQRNGIAHESQCVRLCGVSCCTRNCCVLQNVRVERVEAHVFAVGNPVRCLSYSQI